MFRFGVTAALLLSSSMGFQQPQTATPTKPQQASTQSSVGPSAGTHYTNSSGRRVHVPVQAPSAPFGATAKCRDGSYSFSQHANGTCSHHRGVYSWLIH